MSGKIFIPLFLFLCSAVFSQTSIHFHSEFEEKTFEKLQNRSSSDVVELLLACSQSAGAEGVDDINESINDFIRQLDERKLSKRNLKKKVKYIFEEVHSNFFKKYVDTATFKQIFTSGEYNCVSASALYAVIFNRLGVKYNIHEEPTHVYLIVSPNEESILVETTVPGKEGFYAPNSTVKQKFIDGLIEQKLITPGEVTSVGKDQVFNNFLFSQDTTTLRGLAAIQYSNKAVFYFNDGLTDKALNSVSKALKIKKTEALKNFENSLLITRLNELNFDDPAHFKYVVQLIENTDYDEGLIADAIENFVAENSSRLERFSDIEYLHKSYDVLRTSLLNNKYETELTSYYHSLLADYHYNLQSYKKAIELYEKVYKVNDKNIRIRNMIANAVVKLLSTSTHGEELDEKFTEYLNRFPFLQENNLFSSYRINNRAFMLYKLAYKDIEEKHKVYEAANHFFEVWNETGNRKLVGGYQRVAMALYAYAEFLYIEDKLNDALDYVNEAIELYDDIQFMDLKEDILEELK